MLRSVSLVAFLAYVESHTPAELAAEALNTPSYLVRRRYLLWEAARRFWPPACRELAKFWSECKEPYAKEIASFWTELCDDWLPLDPPDGSSAALFYAGQKKEFEEKQPEEALELYMRAAESHPLAAASVFRLEVHLVPGTLIM